MNQVRKITVGIYSVDVIRFFFIMPVEVGLSIFKFPTKFGIFIILLSLEYCELMSQK